MPLDTLLETADVASLHTALNESTRGMIGREALSRMKPKAILINTCRGEVVDEEALIEALKEGRLLGAGLDTLRKEPTDLANPILQLPNVVLTPHSAGPTVDSFRKRFQTGTRISSESPTANGRHGLSLSSAICFHGSPE